MHLIARFWKHAMDRGDTPRPVWAIVSMGGSQPEGYVVGWSVSKRRAQRELDGRGDAHTMRLVRIVP